MVENNYYEKENAPYAGKFEITTIEGDGEAETKPIKVIGLGSVFAKDQRNSGTPIITYRNGPIGTCSVILNLSAFSSIEEVVEFSTGKDYFVIPGKTTPNVLLESEYKNELHIYGEFLDNSPRLLLRATTISGLPFYASITYTPTPFRHPPFQPK